tara:strand:- start:133 stop:600 length:468 start_codon:yes stop_codon:yes gene_type:complete
MIFQFKTEQFLNCDIKSVWNFVSSPKNLSKITPPYMLFKITSDNINQKMYPGMIISYKVAPMLNIKINWVTEITQVVEENFFIDEQRIGPYSLWHHQHFFKQIDNGVLMTDIVTYKPPFGFIGCIANTLFIKKKLKSIFDYRFHIMDKKFNKLDL